MRYKNIEVGCCVTGSFGENCPNLNPNIRQWIRTQLFGNIVCMFDRKKYKVAWDDGTTSDCYSNSLSKRLNLLLFHLMFSPLHVSR
jgi:hypothetical protein